MDSFYWLFFLEEQSQNYNSAEWLFHETTYALPIFSNDTSVIKKLTHLDPHPIKSVPSLITKPSFIVALYL